MNEESNRLKESVLHDGGTDLIEHAEVRKKVNELDNELRNLRDDINHLGNSISVILSEKPIEFPIEKTNC